MTELMKNALNVSRGYVRNLLYVDNHVYEEPEGDEKASWVRPDVWVSACAKHGVAACLYEISEAKEPQEVENLLSRADICVIDWKMPVPVTDSSEDANSNQETAKALLCAYISKAREMPGPRLFCVLTLDDSGARSIISDLPNCKKDGAMEGAYFIEDASVKIVVVKRDPGKYKDLVKVFGNEGVNSAGNAEIEEGRDDLENSSSSDDVAMEEEDGSPDDDVNVQVGYLLDYLMLRFAEMHKGIVPTLLLKLLADIRMRTPELMKWFSANLDCAYVVEAALSAYPEYAPEMLTKAITDAIASSFQYQMGQEKLVSELVGAWCTDNEHSLSGRVKLSEKTTISVSKEESMTWLHSGLMRFCECKIPDDKERKAILRNATDLVSAAESIVINVCGSKKKVKASCLDYACRCSQKSMSGHDGNVVRLTAGSVVRDKVGKHYVCLQQGCDSLRLEAGQARHFFFLPLEETDSQDGAVSTTNGEVKKFLVPSRRAYTLTMVDFTPDGSSIGTAKSCYTDVRAEDENGKFVFKGKREGSDEVLQWEFDLKKDIAMKIADDFAHQFSRVAVDGSEWLRLKGKGLMPLESESPILLSEGEGDGDGLIEYGELGCTESPMPQTIIK